MAMIPTPVKVPGGKPRDPAPSFMEGLFSGGSAPWLTMGAGLLAAGAPTIDPGHFGTTLGQTFAATGQQFQNAATERKQAKAIEGLLAGGNYTPQQQAAMRAMDSGDAIQLAGASAFQPQAQPKTPGLVNVTNPTTGEMRSVVGTPQNLEMVAKSGYVLAGDYQAPKAATPKSMWAFDREAGKMGYFPEATVAANPMRFAKDAPKPSGPDLDSGELRNWANDFDRDMAPYMAQAGAYQRLENIFDAPGDAGRDFMERARHNATFMDAKVPPSQQAAADIALVFAFMKTIDPGSTVREGEFATASNAGTVVDSIRNMYNSLLETGGRLTDQQRQSFLIQANRGYQQALADAGRVKQRYQGLLPTVGLGGVQDQILYDLYQPRFSFGQGGGAQTPTLPTLTPTNPPAPQGSTPTHRWSPDTGVVPIGPSNSAGGG
jgi:hypothetical protein